MKKKSLQLYLSLYIVTVFCLLSNEMSSLDVADMPASSRSMFKHQPIVVIWMCVPDDDLTKLHLGCSLGMHAYVPVTQAAQVNGCAQVQKPCFLVVEYLHSLVCEHDSTERTAP